MLHLLLTQAHSSVERAGLIGGVMMRKVPTDDSYAVTGDMLKKMVEEDKAAGLIPFYVSKDRNLHPLITKLTHLNRHITRLILNMVNFPIALHTSAIGLILLLM